MLDIIEFDNPFVLRKLNSLEKQLRHNQDSLKGIYKLYRAFSSAEKARRDTLDLLLKELTNCIKTKSPLFTHFEQGFKVILDYFQQWENQYSQYIEAPVIGSIKSFPSTTALRENFERLKEEYYKLQATMLDSSFSNGQNRESREVFGELKRMKKRLNLTGEKYYRQLSKTLHESSRVLENQAEDSVLFLFKWITQVSKIPALSFCLKRDFASTKEFSKSNCEMVNCDELYELSKIEGGFLFYKLQYDSIWKHSFFYMDSNFKLHEFIDGVNDCHVADLTLSFSREVSASECENKCYVLQLVNEFGRVYFLQALCPSDYDIWCCRIKTRRGLMENNHLGKRNFLKLHQKAMFRENNGIFDPFRKIFGLIPRNNAETSEKENFEQAKSFLEENKCRRIGHAYIKEIGSKHSKSNTVSLFAAPERSFQWTKVVLLLLEDGRLMQYKDGSGFQLLDSIDITKVIRTNIQLVSKSLFDRKNCIAIKTTDSIKFLSFLSEKEGEEWLFLLKGFSDLWKTPQLVLFYRKHRVLNVCIIEGRHMQYPDNYVQLLLDEMVVAKTCTIYSNKNPYWKQGFTFEDVGPLTEGFTLLISYPHQYLLSFPIAYKVIHVKPKDIVNNITQEKWCSLPSNDSLLDGELRISFSYQELTVMTEIDYEPLIRLISEMNIDIDIQLSNVIGTEELVEVLLPIYDISEKTMKWILELMKREVDSTRDAKVLFRQSTIFTKAVDIYTKKIAGGFLEHALGEVIRSICASNSSCEVDPSKIEKPECLEKNWKSLFHHVNRVWQAVGDSCKLLPRNLRYLFSEIKSYSTLKFESNQDSNNIGFISISAFFFLRFICAACLSPVLFDLVKDYPSPTTSRTLTLIAKSIMNLANFTHFGMKEQYMERMNEFITENIVEMKNVLTNVSSSPPLSELEITYCIDKPTAYSKLHNLVVRNRNPLLSLKDPNIDCLIKACDFISEKMTETL